MKSINDNLEGENGTLEEKHYSRNNEKYTANKGKLEQADRLFREDPKFIELTTENTDLKEKLKQTDKELFDINYRVK